MADETTLTTVNDTVPAADVANTVRTWPYPNDLADLLFDEATVQAGNGGSLIVPRWNAWSVPAGTKSEVAAFTRSAIGSDGVTIASGVVGGEMRLSREVQHDSRAGLPRSAIEQGMKAMRARLLADVLALVPGCGATFNGLPATSFNLEHIIGAVRIAEDMSMQGPLAMVISPFQAQTLRTQLVIEDSGLLGPSGLATKLFAGHNGFIGECLGIGLFVSPLVVEDGEGTHALLFSSQKGNRPIVRAVWDELHAENMAQPGVYADDWWLIERRGIALALGTEASPGANCVEVISAAEA